MSTDGFSMDFTGFEPELGFPLDPALQAEFEPLNSNTVLDTNIDVNLNFPDFEPGIVAMNDQAVKSNKLRIEEILRSGADYRRADYHKAPTAWVCFLHIFKTPPFHKKTGQTHI